MCGILLSLLSHPLSKSIHNQFHRGPDEHKKIVFNKWHYIFDRLSINDIENGSQPFQTSNSVFMCNGEIYNNENLKNMYKVQCESKSDCEPIFRILDLILSVNMHDQSKYHQTKALNISSFLKQIDGVFAFAYSNDEFTIIARDPIGIRPLFYSIVDDEIIGFSSEAKCLLQDGATIHHFPPGECWIVDNDHDITLKPKNFKVLKYNPLSFPMVTVNKPINVYATVKTLLTDAVKKRLMSDVPIAFFLSGGLDSSLIVSIACRLMNPKNITTYSIGTKGSNSPDLIAANEVAKYLGTNHVNVEFDVNDAFHEIEKVIYHLESYDCTTVRASVPMFILAKHVAKLNQHKVILSGEGADELFGGYLYLHDAPSSNEFQHETIRLIKHVHQFDALRADRCLAAHGLEVRVPFFDKRLVEYVTSLHPDLKKPNQRCEKLLLRNAFNGYLPTHLLYRQKNGMSDAVGYSWVDFLKSKIDSKYDINDISYDINPPFNNEEAYYRHIYHSLFQNKVFAHQDIWRPKWTTETDPSARKLTVFNDIY